MPAGALTSTRTDDGPMLNSIDGSTIGSTFTAGGDCVAVRGTLMQAADPFGAAPLDASDMARALALAGCGECAVEVVAVTGSTNEDLVARARVRQPSGPLLRAASFQTSGRGRRQRLWRAAPNDALLFSVAIPVGVRTASVPAITLACGVALAEYLASRGVPVQLKWPNDIRINGCKLAGILTELVADRDARQTLVIGVGMNVRLDNAARSVIGQPAIALDQLLGKRLGESALHSREQWIGDLGGAIVAAAARFMQDGFGPFCARFNQLLESRGEMVDVSQGQADGKPAISGRLIEVDGLGQLVIEVEGRHHSVSVGDVSVRQ